MISLIWFAYCDKLNSDRVAKNEAKLGTNGRRIVKTLKSDQLQDFWVLLNF